VGLKISGENYKFFKIVQLLSFQKLKNVIGKKSKKCGKIIHGNNMNTTNDYDLKKKIKLE